MELQYREKALAPAKLNLYLKVLGKREDGYHEIETVMHAVDLCDELTFSPGRGSGIDLRTRGGGLPPPQQNLVFKAARLLQQRCHRSGSAAIELTKKIPAGAGLGGGSSDAAATLKMLSRVWQLDIGPGRLEKLAAEIGSDVPFFIRGGSSVCSGRGEIVRPLRAGCAFDFVLALPPVGVSTAGAYGVLDSLTDASNPANIERIIYCLEQGDPEMLGKSLHNDFRRAAPVACPELKTIAAGLEDLFCETESCGCSISGSGSAWFGLYRSRKEAAGAARYIGERTAVHALAVRSV